MASIQLIQVCAGKHHCSHGVHFLNVAQIITVSDQGERYLLGCHGSDPGGGGENHSVDKSTEAGQFIDDLVINAK